MRDHEAHVHRGKTGHLFAELLPLEEALDRALAAARPVGRTETLPLEEAGGRVLAEAVTAPGDVPTFPKATMDGFALRSADAARPGATLRIVGAAHPGEPFRGSVGPGEAVRAATGAALPEGCDAVVEVEEAEATNDQVRLRLAPRAGRNVQPRGDDIREGDVLLEAGTVLTPGRLGAAAAVGVYQVSVYARPRAAIYATGREVKRGGALEPGEIHDINSFTLAGLVAEHGGRAAVHDPIPDTYEAIRDAVATATDHDLVVLSGSTSVGERDFLRDAAQELGELTFHGVAVKPGMPLLLARVGDGLVFGMPGFPASCLLTAYHVLVPVLRRTARLPPLRRTQEAVLGEDLPVHEEKTQLVSVRLDDGRAHRTFRHSGSITGVSQGDGYTVVSPGERKRKGERVEVTLF